MEVREGEIVGLIGPNGAGKTTFFECISGFQPYSSGRIDYRGDDLSQIPPERRAWIGIGRTLQNVRLFPYLSVVDNIRIALHRHMKRSAVEHAFSPAARGGRGAVDPPAGRARSSSSSAWTPTRTSTRPSSRTGRCACSSSRA